MNQTQQSSEILQRIERNKAQISLTLALTETGKQIGCGSAGAGIAVLCLSDKPIQSALGIALILVGITSSVYSNLKQYKAISKSKDLLGISRDC